ncbi:MAG: DUF5984 family protein [Casimicrobium sp.]
MQKHPLFDFELFHPSEIHPWMGYDGNDPQLSYDHLSQGYVCFNAGDAKLFEYSSEIVTHWEKLAALEGQVAQRIPVLADQHIWRVHLDLTDGLNRFLEPIPEDLKWWMMPQRDAPGSRWLALCIYAWNDESAVNCSLLADRVRDGFCGRLLQWDRLIQEPQISIWSDGFDVFVSWDNRDRLVEGIPVWTAKVGLQTYTRDDFLREMEDFRVRYFEAMFRQFSLVRTGALQPNIRTDVDYCEKCLREDQAETLEHYINTPQPEFGVTDWDAVRLALSQTLELTGLKLT